MFTQKYAPRYLISCDLSDLPTEHVPAVVVGSGIAGSRAALEVARDHEVLLLTKENFKESNTNYALGGIAAALSPHDTPERHAEDTIDAGKGLVDEELVHEAVREGQERVREMIEWGADFDEEEGEIDFTREGGHSERRILHAGGDKTGEELASTLEEEIKRTDRVEVREEVFVIDLLTDSDGCCGVLIQNGSGERKLIISPAVILCSGGAGQLYRETTNPGVTTGDGLAMAYRAGAQLRDLEFYQFHPTTLYIAGSGRSLISESVRGEGAKLIDRNGHRFMEEYHPDGELAPRDIVSRGIVKHISETDATCVYLDLSDMEPDFVHERFPRLSELCQEFQIDVATDPVPVHPSAHYLIGGIQTDHQGQTTIPGLYAAGEVASTGFHGANRLGSNSLLEGLVFGCRCGQSARDRISGSFDPDLNDVSGFDESKRSPEFIDLTDMRDSVQSLNWRQCGIIRSEDGIRDALYKLNFWCSYLLDREMNGPEGWEVQNLFTLSRLMSYQTLCREESRGVHYRSDYPDTRDEEFGHSQTLNRSAFPDRLEEAVQIPEQSP